MQRADEELMSVCLGLLLCCRELLDEVMDSITEEAGLGDWGVEKANFVGLPHLSLVQL